MLSYLRIAQFSALLLMTTRAAHALLLSPMSASLSPSGSGATQSFEVTNQFDKTIAVQLSVGERIQTESGKEEIRTSPDISKKFILFPAALSLKPQEKRLVRLAWRGEPQISRELNYRLVAEQLPISGTNEKPQDQPRNAMVNLLMKYIAAVYITPQDARPNLEIIKVTRVGGKMRLRVKNSGGRHQILRRFSLQWKDGRLPEDEPRELAGQNILAGQERDFEFTWPKSIATTATNYRFVLAP
jgi:fimbrial chaperone protein